MSKRSRSPTDEEQEELKQLAANLENFNKSAFCFALTGTTNAVPEISLAGATAPLDFPLTSKSLSAIEALCVPAVMGKGTETVLDPSIRNALSLDADKFAVGGTKWEAQMSTKEHKSSSSTLLGDVAEALAPGADVVAKLYKMTVYKEGCFFKTHVDTYRGDGMFATLVVALPSAHTGGTLRVTHGGEEVVFRSDDKKLCAKKNVVQWAAFYTDAHHEVELVKSGTRCTLLYHLYARESEQAPAAPLEGTHPAIKSLLTLATQCQATKQPRYLGYLLHHKYPGSGLKPAALKGHDKFLYEQMSQVAKTIVAAIDIRFHGWGPSDEAKWAQLSDLGKDYDAEVSQLDTSSKPAPGCKAYPSRPLDGVDWLVQDLAKHAHRMKRTDRSVSGSGNEGCDFHETYQAAALLIAPHCKPGARDAFLDSDASMFSLSHTQRDNPYYGC
eukprot:jgi/Mesvir1/173/Mv13530-RA.1